MLKLVVVFDDIGYLCTHNILGGIIMNDIERILNYSSDEYGEYLRVKSAIEYHLHAWHDEFDKKILRGKYNPTLWNRVGEYRNFICKKLQVETLTRDTTTMLLSQTRKEISNCIVFEESVQGNHAIGIVEDAMKYHFSLAQKRWKHGEENFYDISQLFLSTQKTLLKFSKEYSVGSYLKSKCLEYLILKLRHEFAIQEEEQKRRIREEQKALKELKREKELAEKDAAKAQAAIEKNESALAKAKTNAQVKKLQAQIQELKIALQRAEERRDRAISMAQQTRCGYVYIISNIGSFGEGVYKIGLTRRLDPMDRVRELGDASVPFPFDVHTFIYSEDAPGLEAALHRRFQDRKLNAVNLRKEYFRVSLDEIREEVSRLGIVCEWVERPAAAQWRDSQGGPQEYHYEFNPFEEE